MGRDTEEWRAGGRGTEERGQRERTLFFLPSSERVAIDTVHLIKICAYPPAPPPTPEPLSLASPPLSLSGALGSEQLPVRSAHSSSSAVRCRTEKTRRQRGLVGWTGSRRGLGHMPPLLSYAAVSPPPSHNTHTHRLWLENENDHAGQSGKLWPVLESPSESKCRI